MRVESANLSQTVIAPEQQYRNIEATLFKDKHLKSYAVIDGARVKHLKKELAQHNVTHCCLWAGALEPSMQQVAPYLVELTAQSSFLRWLLHEGWGKGWGIYLTSDYRLKPMRKHLRKFLQVKGPEGQTLIFRFYDPCVMSSFKMAATPEQRDQFLDNCSVFFESALGTLALEHWLKNR